MVRSPNNVNWSVVKYLKSPVVQSYGFTFSRLNSTFSAPSSFTFAVTSQGSVRCCAGHVNDVYSAAQLGIVCRSQLIPTTDSSVASSTTMDFTFSESATLALCRRYWYVVLPLIPIDKCHRQLAPAASLSVGRSENCTEQHLNDGALVCPHEHCRRRSTDVGSVVPAGLAATQMLQTTV